MNDLDVAAYFARIDYAGSRAPTLATLVALHRAHLAAVPFENLDIHSTFGRGATGRSIVLDRAALFRKIVGERRGGFCYEQNGLFADVLASLGFAVELLSARVAHDGGGFGPEFDHLALRVDLGDEGRWLADVGYGRSFHEPLSLDAPLASSAEGFVYRALEDADGWRVEARGPDGATKPEYAFGLVRRRLEEFEPMCSFHQSSPESYFTRQIVCTRPTARGRVTVTGRALVITDCDDRRETELADEAAVEAALLEHFDLRVALRSR